MELYSDCRIDNRCGDGERVLEDLPIILVVEDDQLVQGLLEEALTEARFEPAIVSSASGDPSNGKDDQLPGAYNRRQAAGQNGRLGSRPPCQKDRS